MYAPKHNSLKGSREKGGLIGVATGGRFVVDPIVYPRGVSKALHTPKPCKKEGCEGLTHAMSGFCKECRTSHNRAKYEPKKAKHEATFQTTDDVLAFYRSLPK